MFKPITPLRMLPVAVVAAWVLMALAGCNQTKKEDNPIFWQLNFEPDSKAPYGCALAYQSLKTYFGVASVQKLPQNFIVSTLNNKTPPNGNVVVLVGQRAYFDREEWEEIHTFVEKGNDLLIATSNSYYYYGDNPMYGGDVSTHGEYSGNPTTLYETDLPMADSDTHPLTWNGDSVRYGYRGKNLVSEVRLLHPVCNPYHHDTTMIGDEYFKQTHYPVLTDTSSLDSQYLIPVTYTRTVLGKCKKDPHCVSVALGKGHIVYCATPFVFSNYFLTQPKNYQYLNHLLSSVNRYGNGNIYWNSFLERAPEDLSFFTLLRYPALRWAYYLAIFGLITYILFNLRGRQRVIPIIPPLKNESVAFAETVGMLYYRARDNGNLLEKISLHFLEWVRTTYYLNTRLLDDNFATQLAEKSGKSLELTKKVTAQIIAIKDKTAPTDDDFLIQFYTNIQNIYK